jgi:hypothetical protein
LTDNDFYLDILLAAADPVDEESLPLPSESPLALRLYEQITGLPYADRVAATNGANGTETL